MAIVRGHRPLAIGLIALLVGPAAGCRRGGVVELTGTEARRRLPEEVRDLVPPDVTLRHEEEGHQGAYRLWILHKPGGTWLDLAKLKRKGIEHHALPPSALETILRSKAPSIDLGRLAEPRCRFTHWRPDGGTEIQIRQLVTDRGWFASVEQVRF